MKIGNKMVKALAVLSFALLCVFALLVPSFAEGEVAKVYDADGTEANSYATLEEALVNVPEGGTVEVLKDTTLSGNTVEIHGGTKKPIGYSLELPAKSYTIKGVTGEETVTLAAVFNEEMSAKLGTYLIVRNRANVTIENIAIKSEMIAPYAAFRLGTNGKLTIRDGASIAGISNNGSALFIDGNGIVTMEGGALSGSTSGGSYGTVALFSGGAKFIMNGGVIKENTFTGNGVGTAIYTKGIVELNGGEITANGNVSRPGKGAVYAVSGSKVIFNGTAIHDNSGANVYVESGVTVTGIPINNVSSDTLETGAVIYYDDDCDAVTTAKVNNSRNDLLFYNNLSDAINGVAADATITLLKDVSYVSSTMSQAGAPGVGYHDFIQKNLTIDGNGHKLSLDDNTTESDPGASSFIITRGATLTIKNMTLLRDTKGRGSYPALRVNGASAINVENSVLTARGNSNGAVFMIEGDATVNLDADTKITGCTSGAGIIWLWNGTLTLDGTEISGNSSAAIEMTKGTVNLNSATIKNNAGKGAYGGVYAIPRTGNKTSVNVTLNINGETYIKENTNSGGKASNIWLGLNSASVTGLTADDVCTVNIAADFSGKIGISGTAFATGGIDYATEGNVIAACAEGYEVADVEAIVCDNTNFFAYADGTDLKLSKVPELKIETDKGKYVKGEATYGIIRVLTTSTNDAETPLEYYGTAFVLPDASIVNPGDPQYKFTAGNLGQGKGFIVDMVEEGSGVTIPENESYDYFPVSYYKIKGVKKVYYIHSDPVTFNKATEKTVEYTD